MSNLSVSKYDVIIKVPVTEKKRFTIGKFYSEFLTDVSNYVYSYEDRYSGKKLVFDFSEVREIEPLVLPNLLTMGIGLNRMHRSVTEIQNVSGAAAFMLTATNFKYIAESERIYSFELDNSISDTEKTSISNCRMFFHYFRFPYRFKDYSESDFEINQRCYNELVDSIIYELDEYEHLDNIRNMLNDEIVMTDAEFKSYTEELDNKVINTIEPIGRERLVQTGVIFKCIFENIKNAYMHGLSGCVVMICARPYSKLKKEKIEIAVSDVGKGIPYSIKNKMRSVFKDKKTSAFDLRKDLSVEEKEKYNINYQCILESIFYRAKRLDKNSDNIFGLFDVICSVLRDNDEHTKSARKVYIHSDSVRLCLTNKFYEKYLKNCISRDDGKIDKSVAEAVMSKQVYSFNDDYSYLKESRKFGGAHLEYEFFIDIN